MNHTEIINLIIDKFKYQSYLEIGTRRNLNFNQIKCQYKTGVDPDPKANATYCMTSDKFFENYTGFPVRKGKDGPLIHYGFSNGWDCIFIDGYHGTDQVEFDIYNSIVNLKQNGTIIIDDLNPPNEKTQRVPRIQQQWTGNGWRAWLRFRAQQSDYKTFVIDLTYNKDWGLGIIRRGPSKLLSIEDKYWCSACKASQFSKFCSSKCEGGLLISYEEFDKDRKRLLNLISEEEFLEWLQGEK